MNGLIRTILLFSIITIFLGLIGFRLGGFIGVAIGIAISGMIELFVYYNADLLTLRLYKTQPLSSNDEKFILPLLEDLTFKLDMFEPEIYVNNCSQANIFSVGRNPKNASIVLTQGLLDLLNDDELKAVLAHELYLIKYYYTLIMGSTAIISGSILMLSNLIDLFVPKENITKRNKFKLIFLNILGPLASFVVQGSISRELQFKADRNAALICENPLALATALEKIYNSCLNNENIVVEENPSFSHMFIVNPLNNILLITFFATHPSNKQRIERLLDINSGGSR